MKANGSAADDTKTIIETNKGKTERMFQLALLFVYRAIGHFVGADDDAKIGTVATASARRLSFGLRSHLLFFILVFEGAETIHLACRNSLVCLFVVFDFCFGPSQRPAGNY